MIPREECEDRRLYLIRSRNLLVGAFRAETGGFIGIREKFHDLYLFEEYHRDNGPPYGTVAPVEALDAWVPEDVPLSEFLPDHKTLTSNRALFDFLEPYDTEAHDQRMREHEIAAAQRESEKWRPQTYEEYIREGRQQKGQEYMKEQRAAGADWHDIREGFMRILKGEEP
jgi:hypothetical protein